MCIRDSITGMVIIVACAYLVAYGYFCFMKCNMRDLQKLKNDCGHIHRYLL